MSQYQIFTGNSYGRSIFEAASPEGAINQWLDMMGYESKREAAAECFCEENEIVAKPVRYR